MVFAMLTKVITLHIKATIVKVGVLYLKNFIPRCGICFAIFLTLNKQFKAQLSDFLQLYIVYILGGLRVET